MEESTCHEMVIYLSHVMVCFFSHFFINCKYDFHVDADKMTVKPDRDVYIEGEVYIREPEKCKEISASMV